MDGSKFVYASVPVSLRARASRYVRSARAGAALTIVNLGTEPRLLLHTERYTEGVVVDRDGTLYFSMTALGTISRFVPRSVVAQIWAHVPDANGHAIEARVTAEDPERLTYPNDVALDSGRGGFYVTDSGYKATPKTIPADPQGRVYRVDAHGRIGQVADGIAYSNGVALSPARDKLYVGESTARRIWSYAVCQDGTLGARTLFADVPDPAGNAVPDGISTDDEGRLYVAHYGAGEVLVYEPDGTLARRLNAGNNATSHVALGPDGGTLYVSGGIEDEQGAGAIFEIAL